jgi:hypothetical protein
MTTIGPPYVSKLINHIGLFLGDSNSTLLDSIVI